MTNGVSTIGLDQLIQAALTGQPYNQQRLGKEAERYSLRLSFAKAPDLPEDLHDEICLQAFVELMQLGADALQRHSGRILFRHAVLAAIRSVRASYAAPGERTRIPKSERPDQARSFKVAAEDVGRIPDADTIERATVTQGAFSLIDFDRLPDRQQDFSLQRVEDGIEADGLLRPAPPEVARALRMIHLDDVTLSAAATRIGISRFVLAPRIKAFCEWRVAA